MRKLLFILGCGLMLCGCTQSRIVDQGGALEPDFQTREGIEFEWQQAFDEMGAEYVDGEEVVDLSFFMGEEEDGSESLYLTVLVSPEMTPAEGALLGTNMVKSFGNIMADQDFSLDKASEQSYGGFFKTYNVGVRVIPEDQTEDQSMALVDDLIMAGEAYRPVNPNR